ncbi:hypothetical protein ACM66B_005114 [Microbotryomycetes sp. NB124-2]
MSLITVRIRGPDGVSSAQLSHDDTLSALQLVIEHKTGIPQHRQELRTGFPPKPLATDISGESTLKSIGINAGEQIVVAEAAADIASNATSSQARSVSTPTSAPAPPPVMQKEQPRSPPTMAPLRSGLRSVPVDGGNLILRVVPDDNSCLYSSSGLLLEPGRDNVATYLRQIVADEIRANPDTWSDAMLGRPRAEYVSTILSKNSWGGAIELSILAQRYQVEICSIDVQTGRIDRFGYGNGYSSLCFVVYSGIHYDALTFSFMDPETAASSLEFDILKFESGSEQAQAITRAALELVSQLRKEHAYTDAATFTLKCEQCGTAIVGEKDARAHAMQTGHTQFGEYDG